MGHTVWTARKSLWLRPCILLKARLVMRYPSVKLGFNIRFPASALNPFRNALRPAVLLPFLLIAILGGAIASSAVASAGLTPMTLEKAFPNLTLPDMVHMTHAGDGTDRLWVVLRSGEIMVFPNSVAVGAAKVFLDIGGRVTASGEEGLLGLAFDPQYAANGYLYVYYSAASPRRSVISRFSAGSSDPDRADAASELVVLEVPQPFPNHNGGTIAFGPDGYLYIGLGDGGSGGDPQGHGQNTATLLGSFLRIDVSNSTPQEPYRNPPDNPFTRVAVRRERGDMGLRREEPLEVLLRLGFR